MGEKIREMIRPRLAARDPRVPAERHQRERPIRVDVSRLVAFVDGNVHGWMEKELRDAPRVVNVVAAFDDGVVVIDEPIAKDGRQQQRN
jgi:hypothetical protein